MNALKLLLLALVLAGCVGTPGPQMGRINAEVRAAPANVLPALPLVSAAGLPPPGTKYLVWDGPPPFTVRTGPSRGNYTNSFTVTSNAVVYTPGVAYSVENAGGASPWPSNRIAELWLTGYGAGLSGSTNIARLVQFTNHPPGNMQFWGIEDRTTGWN